MAAVDGLSLARALDILRRTLLTSGTFMNGFNHSDELHIVERFRLSRDATTLWLVRPELR